MTADDTTQPRPTEPPTTEPPTTEPPTTEPPTTEMEPIDHVLMHARDALATDGRVGELGLDLVSEDLAIVVRGQVSTAERRLGVLAVVHEVLRDHACDREVRDETTVTECAPPDGEPERL